MLKNIDQNMEIASIKALNIAQSYVFFLVRTFHLVTLGSFDLYMLFEDHVVLHMHLLT